MTDSSAKPDYTHLRFHFSGVIIDEFKIRPGVVNIKSQNEFGGIGKITLLGQCSFFSDGWYSCYDFSSQICNLKSVYLITLSTEDEPELLWEAPGGKFSYYKWRRSALLLSRRLTRIGCGKL